MNEIAYRNNPEAAIGEMKKAIGEPRAARVPVETVRMAKKILMSSDSTSEMMKTANELKTRLMGLSSDGKDAWNKA